MSIKQERRVAVVTGASAGIGKSTARMLVEKGWHVIGTGRDPARSAQAEAEIRASAPAEARIDFIRGDFTEMTEVKRLAQEIRALAPRLDVLINNAGGVRDGLHRTSEGLEATMATNHFAPFVLTRELLPLLKETAAKSPPGSVRVIATSSSGHQLCSGMNWADLNMFENFSAGGVYCQAKLANILFIRELQRRYEADGIVAQAMHPGVVASNFASHGDNVLQQYMASQDSQHPDRPAETLVWMAVAAEAGAPGGRYFHERQEVPAAPQALDDAAAQRLWVESARMMAEIGV